MIVEVKNLVRRYQNKIAVDNMNLSIRKGEIVGLLGPNGAGKTTLIQSMIGVSEIQSGEIRMFGKNMMTDAMSIKGRIGVVPQNIALIDDFSAIENVTYFGRLYGLRGARLKEGVQKALEFTNLWDRRKESPRKYSGGMQRRLNIACSIVHSPELIIMDEPTVGIDPQSRNHILESIKALNASGTTIVYTSHYMEEVEAICSRVVIMDNGRLIAEGTKEELAEFVQEEQIAEMELSHVAYSMTEAVKAINGVKECTYLGEQMTVIFDRSISIAVILQAIAEQGASIKRISMQAARLEDVFLSLTGKRLRD